MSKVFIDSIQPDYETVIARGLESTGIAARIARGAAIAIKPNLTYPMYRKGVMTSPAALEGLIKVLKNFTDRITICESDSGGSNRFSMDGVFRDTGIAEMARRYGVRVLNMSDQKSRRISVVSHGKTLTVPLPVMLLDETDMFITMPVPKIHMNTIVSVSVKNQWGVIQIPSERLKLHPYFADVIYAVNKHLPNAISIVDGRYGLTRSGPMGGDPVDLNWLMVSDNLFAADFVCCTLMGIEPASVPYLRKIFKAEHLSDMSQIEFSTDIHPFISATKFFLKRKWTDYPGMLAFNSRPLAYLAYESPLAGVLHWLLYRFREPFYDYEKK